jgi:hypothetical protein
MAGRLLPYLHGILDLKKQIERAVAADIDLVGDAAELDAPRHSIVCVELRERALAGLGDPDRLAVEHHAVDPLAEHVDVRLERDRVAARGPGHRQRRRAQRKQDQWRLHGPLLIR